MHAACYRCMCMYLLVDCFLFIPLNLYIYIYIYYILLLLLLAYLTHLRPGHLMVKLDFRNAFNSIRRDLVLKEVLALAPRVYPLAYSAYRYPSLLFHGSGIISSAEGVQQGDPLGPLLFCLGTHHLTTSLKSSFRVFYLDDGTLGGTPDEILSDLSHIEACSARLGLVLNHSKSEVICRDEEVKSSLLNIYPEMHYTDPKLAILLGSPIGDIEAIELAIASKISDLERMGCRLKLLEAHDALCLLRSAFAIPKLQYILRTAPCFLSPSLCLFDNVQRSLLEDICNIKLCNDSWKQASLPVNCGGMGIRSAAMLASSAYLASAAGCTPISSAILPAGIDPALPSIQAAALNQWEELAQHSCDPPSGQSASKQKCWDSPVVEAQFSIIFSNATDLRDRARLQACRQKESSAWLTAPPVSTLGLRMCNTTIRVATSLRLGSPICAPHDCTHCGRRIDERGLHGLSCRRSVGRLPRHTQLNAIIKESLASANVPSVLEPQGLSRLDGKRPDGMSIIPWACGRLLLWDATCWDSFAPSNIQLAALGPGRVADMAARRKRDTYLNLARNHFFVPVAVETTGSFSEDTIAFLHELANRIRSQTHDPFQYIKLCQRLSICVQNFNCASIMGCCTLI